MQYIPAALRSIASFNFYNSDPLNTVSDKEKLVPSHFRWDTSESLLKQLQDIRSGDFPQ